MRKPQTPAVVDLLAGEIDALVFASAPESLMVQMLLQTPGIKLFDFAQAEAYSRRFPFMSPVVLPRGVVDLARDLPPGDVRLVAPTATLVARETTHPALVQLFVQAAHTVHGEAGWFQRKGEFPNARNTEWPLSAEAERFYQQRPAVPAALPAVLAGQPDRPHVGGAGVDRRDPDSAVARGAAAVRVPHPLAHLPLVRPAARGRRSARPHGRADELRARARPSSKRKVERITVPLSYADELYALRSHIHLVRRPPARSARRRGTTTNERHDSSLG